MVQTPRSSWLPVKLRSMLLASGTRPTWRTTPACSSSRQASAPSIGRADVITRERCKGMTPAPTWRRGEARGRTTRVRLISALPIEEHTTIESTEDSDAIVQPVPPWIESVRSATLRYRDTSGTLSHSVSSSTNVPRAAPPTSCWRMSGRVVRSVVHSHTRCTSTSIARSRTNHG